MFNYMVAIGWIALLIVPLRFIYELLFFVFSRQWPTLLDTRFPLSLILYLLGIIMWTTSGILSEKYRQSQ